MILKIDIAEMLKQARLEAGLTQQELAEKAKILQSSISRAEKEGCGISMFSELLDAMGFILVIDYKTRSDKTEVGDVFREPMKREVALVEEIDLPPVKISDKRLENGLCKVHGVPLDSRGKCLQKDCKYA